MKPLNLGLLLAVLSLAAAEARADELTARVDHLFARWDRADVPGCALAVVKDGEVVYERGYGMADLEQGTRIEPSTVFHVASVSKQFTAFAVLLLEREGKLTLKDDVRKYLPELHDFGKPIVIRHLLRHTSGLRDQWGLLMLAGWRIDDVITEDDVFRLIRRQKELNYEPGAEFLYGNTGFTLAAKVVERVTGRPFRESAGERIFGPLGMKRTQFPPDYQGLVQGRARSYHPAGEGRYKNAVLSYGTVGATGLLTTVGDLARWDRNFYEPRVGGRGVVDRLQEVGTLNDGRPTGYALGLEIGDYRGLKTVEHGGGDAGFRCTLLRFPTERFSVILLANAGDFDAGGTARRVADLYLGEKLKPAPPRPTAAARKAVEVDPKLLDAYAGEYRVSPGLSVVVVKDQGRLTVEATGYPKADLDAASDTEFFVRGGDAGITFGKPERGRSARVTVHFAGQDLPAERIVRPALTAEQRAQYPGDYHSEELGTLYTVSVRDGKLMVLHPRGPEELRPVATDVFEAPYPISRVTFDRGAGGRVKGFVIDAGAVRNLRFARVDLSPVK